MADIFQYDVFLSYAHHDIAFVRQLTEWLADEELRAVLTLLAGPGVLWKLAFGSWVLLQPERINDFAMLRGFL
jgi:hypothetical protein